MLGNLSEIYFATKLFYANFMKYLLNYGHN